jgi:hypothetical protein
MANAGILDEDQRTVIGLDQRASDELGNAALGAQASC